MLITRGQWPGPLIKFRFRKSEAASTNRPSSQRDLEILRSRGLRRGLASSFFSRQIPDAFIHVRIYRMIGQNEVTYRKERPAQMLHIAIADGVSKNREQVI